jgi:hypothetical protein
MNVEKLKELYQNTSKHSNYQILPPKLATVINTKELLINSRYENERFEFIKKNLDLTEKSIIDIGGNTGFFTFESLESGASSVIYFEGNIEHAEFVKNASEYLSFDVTVQNKYLNFDETDNFDINVDLVLLLNVIHHLGDDFGNKSISMKEAKIKMINSINYFSSKSKFLVLQMGYCWKGDRELLLFENGSKEEMIDFIKHGISEYWETEYINLNETNLIRNNSLGEFRNRPIFILKSKYNFI